jgi:hypothetical protein
MRAFGGIALVLLVVAAAKLVPGLADPVSGRGTDRYEITPGKGIGPVEIGMSREEARRAMTVRDRAVRSVDRGAARPALMMHGGTFQVDFGPADRVEAVQVVRGSREALLPRERLPFVALLDDVDVFQTPATDLVARVSRKTKVQPSSDDPGVTFEFPTIGLGFWRETAEEGPFFETVYVSRAGR